MWRGIGWYKIAMRQLLPQLSKNFSLSMVWVRERTIPNLNYQRKRNEDGSKRSFRNICNILPNYTASHHRRLIFEPIRSKQTLVSGAKTDEATAECTKLHDDGFHNLWSLPHIIRMGKACRTQGRTFLKSEAWSCEVTRRTQAYIK
jgi:hypothetical protein